MGRFLDEAPTKTYKGKFLDEAMSPDDNSIYSKGGDWDLKKKFGRFSEGPKIMGLPAKELGLTAGIPPLALYEMITKQPSEDLFPALGQTLGGMAGDTVNPVVGGLGATAGATVGQAGRQGVKAMRGFKPSLGQIGAEIPRTGITETLGRVAFGALEPTANQLMKFVVNPSTKTLQRNPRFGLDVLDQGIWGSPRRMVEKAGENIGKFEGEVRGAVRGSPEVIRPRPILKRLGEIKASNRAGLKAGDARGVDDIRGQFIDQYGTGGGMSLERGLDMKKAIYAETPEAAFSRQMTELPGATEGRRAVAQEINKQIGAKVPATVGALQKEAVAVQARKGLQTKMAKGSKLMPFDKLSGMGIGGSVVGGHPATGAGIAIGNAVTGALRSGASLSFVAGQLYNLSKQKSLAGATRLVAAEMLRKLTQGDNQGEI